MESVSVKRSKSMFEILEKTHEEDRSALSLYKANKIYQQIGHRSDSEMYVLQR